MALPTKEEKEILKQFRHSVADVVTAEESKDDMFLLRWLRARDLNLDKAEYMLRNAKKWRQENNVDKIVLGTKRYSYYAENFPKIFNGSDKEDRPVVGVQIGKWDVRKIVRDGKSTEFLGYLTECFEEVMHVIKDSSSKRRTRIDDCNEDIERPPITQLVMILDWNDFAWSQLFSYQCVQNFLQIGSIYEAYYPEVLYRGYFINSPSLISAVMTLLKPILAPKTMSKIKVLGTDPNQWREELFQHIDEDQLTPEFGGTRENAESPF